MSDQTARDEAALKALLGAQPAEADDAFARLGKMRPFTAGTFALLHQTRNEWVLGLLPAEMSNCQFATLAWLYIQSGPLDEVRKVAFDAEKFQSAVIAWGDRLDDAGQPLFTAQMLDAAMAIIAGTLTSKAAAEFSIEPKPESARPDPDRPPN